MNLLRGCLFHWGHLLVLVFVINFKISSQYYPDWFVKPNLAQCKVFGVTVFNPSVKRDSLTIAIATDDAIRNYVRLTNYSAVLKNLYVGMDLGKIWMDFVHYEDFDESTYDNLKKQLVPSVSFFNDTLSIVGVSLVRCDEQVLVDLRSIPKPLWVGEYPAGNNMIVGRGSSVRYYSEASSWNRALDEALKDVLKQLFLKSNVLVKKSTEDFEVIFSEEFEGKLNNIQVIERWIDFEKNLFYVLVGVNQ